jgi:hypothetical protein
LALVSDPLGRSGLKEEAARERRVGFVRRNMLRGENVRPITDATTQPSGKTNDGPPESYARKP